MVLAGDEVLSIADAAAECGVSVAYYISTLVDSGVLLELPDCLDPRCQPATPVERLAYRFRCDDTRVHVDGCNGVAGSSPDCTTGWIICAPALPAQPS